jgi:uncharacterized RDD family membrane protein YckC
MSDLVTGEAVPLEMRLAKFPSRALAMLIDLVVLFIGGLVVLTIIGGATTSLDAAAAAAVVISSLVLLLVGIPTTIETLTRGRSIGKLALGLRVVRDDGGPVRFRHALLRALAGVFVDFYTTLGAGAVISSLLNERGKRVGDWLAGTVVARERVPTGAAPLPAVPPEYMSWAATLELSLLPDDLALAARGYLARGAQLSPRVRDEMGARLATEVSRVVSPPPPAAIPAWAYLAAVLTERGRRESARLAAERAPHDAAGAPSSTESAPTLGAQPGSDATPQPPSGERAGSRFAPPA